MGVIHQGGSAVQASMNRRSFLSSAASLATLTTFAPSTLKALGSSKSRIAVIGGGMSGIASAWLCDGEFQVDLFEARSKLGGHCDSRQVSVQNKNITVDLGAQFFHPGTHPLYTALLEYLGLYLPDDMSSSQVVETKGSLNIFQGKDSESIFTSNSPLSTPLRSLDFALYTRAARAMVLSSKGFDLTVREWIDQIYVTQAFKDSILIPLLSSFAGTSIENTMSMSARSVLSLVALAFPSNLLNPATTFNSNIGLGGILQSLADSCQDLKVFINSPVSQFFKSDDGWYVETPKGRYGPYEHVVLTAPAEASKHMLPTISWAQEIADLLGQFRYFDAKIDIHTDPIYMSQDHRDWGVYNVMRSRGYAEGSAWYGAFRKDQWGRPLSLFKSWALSRSRQSSQLLESREFRHPLITPDLVDTTKRLMTWQGYKGLWFAGQYTTGVDLQETAFYSALRVARQINPQGQLLDSFQNFIYDKGLLGISYEI